MIVWFSSFVLSVLFGLSLFCGCSKCFSGTFFWGGGRSMKYWHRAGNALGREVDLWGKKLRVVGFPVRLITKMWMSLKTKNWCLYQRSKACWPVSCFFWHFLEQLPRHSVLKSLNTDGSVCVSDDQLMGCTSWFFITTMCYMTRALLAKWVLIQRKNIGVGKCYLPNLVPLDILCFWKQEFPSKDFIFNYIQSKMVTAERAHKICRNDSSLGRAKMHAWILKVLCAVWRSVTEYRFFDVLLTVHLSIILVINQLDAQKLVL